jgi:CRISPR-associated protein Cas5/CasD, subtype I-E/ECOLI
MEVLIMRLEAPLMSFGGAIVDNYGIIRDYPSLSMITGLLANAFGYSHGETEKLQRLQERIRFAVRCDREGEKLQDYQTVDLGQDHLVNTGWTTRGKREDRGTGEATKGTHIRYRDYFADALYILALSLDPAKEQPTISDIVVALKEPERPLFIGRKPCLPSTSLFVNVVETESPLSALEKYPKDKRGDDKERIRAWWHDSFGERPQSRKTAIYDERDWQNQIHAGRRFIYEGMVTIPEVSNAG